MDSESGASPGSELLTPWNRTLLENLIAAHLVKKIQYVPGHYPKRKESNPHIRTLISHDPY
jgi:hypothetical protein